MFLARQPRHSVSGRRASSLPGLTVALGLSLAALGLVGYTPAVLGSEAGRQKLTPEQIYELVSPSLCFIVAYNPEDKENGVIGSGFIVSADGDVLTNAHVVEGKVIVEFECGGRKGYQLGLRRYSDDRDLAQLTTNLGVSVPLKLSQRVSPSPGETVYALGSPEGLTGTISSGIVSSLRESDGTKHIQMTAAISPGSSGGPVVDSYGEVVGVSVGGYESGQNLNFAVAISELEEIPAHENPRQAQRDALATAKQKTAQAEETYPNNEPSYDDEPSARRDRQNSNTKPPETSPGKGSEEGAAWALPHKLEGFAGSSFGRNCPTFSVQSQRSVNLTKPFVYAFYSSLRPDWFSRYQWSVMGVVLTDFELKNKNFKLIDALPNRHQRLEILLGSEVLTTFYCLEDRFFGGSYFGVGVGSEIKSALTKKYGRGKSFGPESVASGDGVVKISGKDWFLDDGGRIRFSDIWIKGSMASYAAGSNSSFMVQYWQRDILSATLQNMEQLKQLEADDRL